MHSFLSKFWIAIALVVGSFVVASPAMATGPVTSWAELQDAFSNAPVGSTTSIQLGSDITASDPNTSFLVVPYNSSAGATIILDLNGHHLSIPANNQQQAGISVYHGATLTIEDTASGGVLDVTSADYAAGIGVSYAVSNGSAPRDGGTVNIESGTVNATGGANGAGIGGAYYYGGGTINISGGVVNATGGPAATGIGNGFYQAGASYSNTEATTITISGGTITAHGGDGDYSPDPAGPGIGLAPSTDASVDTMPTIAVSGCANITATGGSGSAISAAGGAAIGAGGDNTYAPALSIDGVAPAGAPTVAGSGAADAPPSTAGMGSAITYSGNASNSLAVTATNATSPGGGGTFEMTCTSVPTTPTTAPAGGQAQLASTGFDAAEGAAMVAAMGLGGLVLLGLRRRRAKAS